MARYRIKTYDGEYGAEIQHRTWWWPFWRHYCDAYSRDQAEVIIATLEANRNEQ